MHEPTQDPRSPSAENAALALIVALAVGLRLWRIGSGLPDFLEEAIPFRIALSMRDAATGRVDWNPHHFNYPSLSIYVHFLVQQAAYAIGRLLGHYKSYADYLLSFTIDPTPMVIPARWVGVLCDALSVVAVARIGRRIAPGAGILAAGLVACAPILIATSRSIFCDSIMAAAAAWSIERMLAWDGRGRRRDLVFAALLVGLAAGAKYPAGALVVPLAWLAWARGRKRGPMMAAAAVGIAAAAFLVTTPFALLDPQVFWRDFSFESGHAAVGHFGSLGHRGFLFHLGNLARNAGWLGLLLLGISPVLLLRRHDLRTPLTLLWCGVVAFGAPIALARIDADRYLLPVILLAAPLVAGCGLIASRLLPPPARTGATVAIVFALAGPALARGLSAASEGADATQVEARRWCEGHLKQDEMLVEEGYAARLPTLLQMRQLRSDPVYALASPATRARYDSIRCFHVVTLPLFVSGPVLTDGVQVLEHSSQLNRVFYEPRLFGGVDYVMTSSAVRGRFEADPQRYPTECAFYRFLDAHADVAARFSPRRGVAGPEIVVCRVGPRYRDAAVGPVDPLWWTAAIPDSARARLEATGGLASLYAERIQSFVEAMGTELATLGRNGDALRFAQYTLALRPGDVPASIVYGVCSGRLGKWDETREATEHAMTSTPGARADPALNLLHARSLERTGARAAALRELRQIVARVDAADPIAAEAQRMISALSAPRVKGS